MGYITPELTGKLPGYLSPSMGLKFADIPNGLGADLGIRRLLRALAGPVPRDPSREGGLRVQGAHVQRPSGEREEARSRDSEWQAGDDGYHRDVLPGRAHRLGVQPPVGFWDPLGFTAEGNAEDFARRLQTEIKHGRVSMLACMGYITPELTGKLPGYLSPSMGLKFADIPNG